MFTERASSSQRFERAAKRMTIPTATTAAAASCHRLSRRSGLVSPRPGGPSSSGEGSRSSDGSGRVSSPG